MGGKGFLRGVFGPETGAQRGALGAVLGPGGRGADRLPLSFQTQAEGDALRPRGRCTAPQEDPRPEARPGREPRGTLGGLAGQPRGAGRRPGWEVPGPPLGGAGRPAPLRPRRTGLGPDGEDSGAGAAACASRSPALSPGVTGAADPSAAPAALQGSAQGGRAAAPWCPWERALPPARLDVRPHHAL